MSETTISLIRFGLLELICCACWFWAGYTFGKKKGEHK